MPQVIFSQAAIQDLQRLRDLLRPKNPIAAEKAAAVILKGLQELGKFPQIGRPVDNLPEEYRDWLIDFGDNGYVARYRLDGDTVVVLAIRHQKEAGF